MRCAILTLLLLTGYFFLACDSPHHQKTDADVPDVDVPDADVEVPDDGDVIDVPDFDIPDGWPPRENCQPTPQNGVSIGGMDYFFSTPYTTQGVALSLGESGNLYYDSGRQCSYYNNINVWAQEIFQYHLTTKEEKLLVAYPSRQHHPFEYEGKVFFSSYYVDYQLGAAGNPWAGDPNIWVIENSISRVYTTWCRPGFSCEEAQISKAGRMLYFEYDPNGSPLLVRMMFHDLNTQETRLIDDQHTAPMVRAIGDRAVFWNYSPCDTFQYYDIARDMVVENPAYNVFAAHAWGKYIAWDNCVPGGSYVMDVESGVARILDEELNLDPNDNQMSIHTGYENLVALVDRARDVPEPGTAAHLWLYDLDTRVERRITAEAAKWTWGGYPIINCEWAIITLMYGKNGTTIEQYPQAALNLQQAGILDENCHLIPGPPVEFTLEEFITASGFTLTNYNPLYD